MYNQGMDVAVTTFRAHLSEWIDRARAGEEIVVTDHGVPVVRILGVDTASLLKRLEAEGVIGRARQEPRTKATGRPRVASSGSVSDLISEQRR